MQTHSAARRTALTLVFVVLPLTVPLLLAWAAFSARAESGGKEPNIPLAIFLVALVFAAVAGAGFALKTVYATTAWKRWGLVLLVTIIAFPLWGIVLRMTSRDR